MSGSDPKWSECGVSNVDGSPECTAKVKQFPAVSVGGGRWQDVRDAEFHADDYCLRYLTGQVNQGVRKIVMNTIFKPLSRLAITAGYSKEFVV